MFTLKWSNQDLVEAVLYAYTVSIDKHCLLHFELWNLITFDFFNKAWYSQYFSLKP